MASSQGSTEKRGGSYTIHAEIGAGGMATVHLGQLLGARGFARTVAIKVLHASYARNQTFVGRFLDEARLVARIHHPNVMPTLDVFTEGDELRIVMDYVAGESLDRLQARARERGERVPPRVACAIIAGALHGLHAAHEAKNEFGEPLGIIHLDVSPQNILVGQDGTTRVLDFGVARAKGGDVEPAGCGKSAYLAPEQVTGAEVSPRTDIFAASVVLWELVTGEPLFAADNHAATMQRVLGAVIPPTLEKVPDLPPHLDELIKTGLQRDPSRRFTTARQMALELERTVAPALPSEVGRWVESVAQETLRDRAAMVLEMEARSARRPPGAPGLPGLVPTREMYEEQAAVNLPQSALEDADSSALLRAPGGEDPMVPERAPDGSVRWKPRPRTPPPNTAALAGRAGGGRRRVATAPARPSPPIATAPRRWKRRTLATAVGGVVVAAGLIALTARVFFWPGYVKTAVIAAAAARGVTLTVSDASLADDGVLLRGLSASLAGVPQVRGTIATASVKTVWGSPAKVVLGKTEVAVDGDAREVLQAVSGWSSAHLGAVRRSEDDSAGVAIEVPTAHLAWTQPSGQEVTRVDAAGVQGTIGSQASNTVGVEVHLLSSALVLETRVGTFGPWSVNVDRTPKGTRARLAFDPAVPDGPNALLVDDAAGDSSFELTIPRVASSALGIPRTVLGADVVLPQQVEIALRYARLSHDQVTASLRAAAYGVRAPELGSSVDARISGEASGVPGGTMTVKNGTFTVGPVRGVLTGTLTPGDAAMKASLAWKADPVLCSTLVALPAPAAAARDLARKASDGNLGDLGELARDFGALGQAAGAVRVSGTFTASGTATVDSANLAGAKFTTTSKNACGIALFQAK
jgi:serine/threonine-protein kinase